MSVVRKWIVGIVTAVVAVGAALVGYDLIAKAEQRGREKEHGRQVKLRTEVVRKLKENDSLVDSRHAVRVEKIDADVADMLATGPTDEDFDRLMREYAP